MKVLTEEILRDNFKKKPLEEVIISKNTIITPSAKEYIGSQKIKVLYEEDLKDLEEKEKDTSSNSKPAYVSYYSNKVYGEKPEYMTHLFGNKLVYKDNKRIKFRGKLDSFQAKILLVQSIVKRDGKEGLVKDLEEILKLTRKVLKAEVTGEDLVINNILGYSESEIRDISHQPEKYFGLDHILPSSDMDYGLLLINELRTFSRELEILGIEAFKIEDGYLREDILTILNRLSSCIYIIMYRYLKSEY